MSNTEIDIKDDKVQINSVHADLSGKSDLIFIGWILDRDFKPSAVSALWNNESCRVSICTNNDPEWISAFLGTEHEKGGLVGRISLPEGIEKSGRLQICYSENSNNEAIFFQSGFTEDMFDRLAYYPDLEEIDENNVYRFKGWVVGTDPVRISVERNGVDIPAKIVRTAREDIFRLFPEISPDTKAGFEIMMHIEEDHESEPFEVIIKSGNYKKIHSVSKRHLKLLRALHGPGYVRIPLKAFLTLKNEGIGMVFKRTAEHLKNSNEVSYRDHIKNTEPNVRDLENERNFWENSERDRCPKFSVVVPMYRTKPRFLDDLIQSMENQTYPRWELCLADAGKDETGKSPSEEQIRLWQAKDKRIIYKKLEKNLSIAENTNEAIKMASGDWIVFSDHDDTIAPFALSMCAKTILGNSDCEVIYSDQDMINYSGTRRYDPIYKPDYNEALFCSRNYISHIMLAKKTLVDSVGGLDPYYDGSQDYDFTFRCCEKAKKICHIPVVLYHWRAHSESTAGNPESKLYAFENGAKAINDHYKRLGIPASAEHTRNWGIYRTTFHWNTKPLVSILIPNKDHIEDLKRCIRSIEQKTEYENYEIIVIENNSELGETFKFYDELEKHDHVKVIRYEGSFNYSAINNLGASNASGEYLLLLNNDTEVINSDWLNEMMGYAQCDDVGIVGAKLLFPDNTIQHAGVVVGYGGTAGHAFKGLKRDDYGYMARLLCTQDYLAVTGACLLTKKAIFDKVGGLSEELAVAFNDIDYCLKVNKEGMRCVWTPYAELYHYESKSRGYETTPEKQERFNNETAIFTSRWREVIEKGDPCYNPNLTLGIEDFSLRNKNDAPVHFE